MILAGIDEAGYGPTLGPLVVSVAAFRIDARHREATEAPDLWESLARVVTRDRDGYRVHVNDSKRLFQQKKGLRELEEGLLPFFSLRGKELPRDLRSLIARVAAGTGGPYFRSGGARSGGPSAYLDQYPWYRGRDLEIPVETFPNFLLSKSEMLEAGLAEAGVDLLGVAARPVDVLEFNRDVDLTRNKAAVSFQVVASFVRRLWRRFPDEDVEILVDRQGGRVHYGPLLFKALRPRGIRIESQTDRLSLYHLSRRRAQTGKAGGRVSSFRVGFSVESESRYFPVALASMLSKYLRELHMVLFNRFWKERRPDLRPTAGYAVDARRFLSDISPLRRDLQIPDDILIRKR